MNMVSVAPTVEGAEVAGDAALVDALVGRVVEGVEPGRPALAVEDPRRQHLHARFGPQECYLGPYYFLYKKFYILT